MNIHVGTWYKKCLPRQAVPEQEIVVSRSRRPWCFFFHVRQYTL